MGPYERLFEINAKHAYFPNLICSSLDWLPTPSTRQAMDNLGMLFRTHAGGMTVFFDPARQEAVSLFSAQVEPWQDSFFFKLYSKDPFFMNYTDLPQTGNDRVIFLDSTKAQSNDDGSLRLHKSAFVNETSIINLSDIGDTPILDRSDRGSPPLCVLRICVAGEKACPVDPKGRIRALSFCINFHCQQTYWKYYVTGSLAGKKISIRDKTEQWSFGHSSSMDLPDSRPTVAFISNKPIPLVKRPQTDFQLRLHTPKAEKVMISRLPAAPVNILHREKRGTKEILVSEIFINS